MKIFVSLLLTLMLCNCKNVKVVKEHDFYIYDKGKIFEMETSEHMIRFAYKNPIFAISKDMVVFIKGTCVYLLDYFKGDTIFKKNKSFLKSIHYFNEEWLKNDLNLQVFWNEAAIKKATHWRMDWGNYRYTDSWRIYFIQDIDNSDSLIIRKVNRDLLPSK